MIDVHIVLIHYTNILDTQECIKSLSKLVIPDGVNIRLIIVDNSTNQECKQLSLAFRIQVTILYSSHNLGFAAGNNMGIREALLKKCDFVWLLNNDTVLQRNALNILNSFEEKTIGIAGSKIYFTKNHEYHRDKYRLDEKGKVFWYAGGIIDWKNAYASHRGVDEVDVGQYDETVETDFVTGCSMMISRKVIETIGLLDERFFLYFEDVDYCIRARKAGFKIFYNPLSVIWHNNASSSGSPGSNIHIFYQTRNRILFANLYCSIRTRFAIFRESIMKMFFGCYIEKKAIIFAYARKYGRID